jgi:CHAD domain-containing protein
MRAMLLLLQEGSVYQYHPALKTIFQHAGRIRSAQIHLQLIAQYRLSYAAFHQAQAVVVSTETMQFLAKKKAYVNMIEQVYKARVPDFHDIADAFILTLYKKRLKRLARFFSKSDHTIQALHKSRKKIKNLLYIHDILSKSLVNKLRLNKGYLNQLQDAIGEWHDVVSVIQLLNQEGDVVKKIRAKLEGESDRLNIAIESLSENFRKKVFL